MPSEKRMPKPQIRDDATRQTVTHPRHTPSSSARRDQVQSEMQNKKQGTKPRTTIASLYEERKPC
ncbi:hypothetical protein LZ30DRAFT_131312 [Colletotrichum cereale]|nr:hypothetical protein LZ30DRAFT_131312 [Colletotrichum cereale]